MRSIHAYWSTDSLAWIAMDRLSERSAFAIPHATLIAAVLDDLFWRVLADAGEVWDTWCNLQTILQDRTAPENVPAILPSLEDICSAASVAEADLVARYQRANAALAKGLVRAWETGRMQCGARSILPFVALFTLNRHGFDQAKAAMIVSAMIVARNPKQQLRGAQLDLSRSCAGSREHHRPRRSAGRMKADD